MSDQTVESHPSAEPTLEAPAIVREDQNAVDVDTLEVPMVELRPALEAILMVCDEPLDHVRLASVVGHPVAAVDDALRSLAAEYAEQGRGFDLRSVAGGWRFYSRAEFAAVVESFVLDGQQARLTKAALETLSVVAYKQPVSRSRVAAIRGVSVDGVMRTLLTRGLIEEAGQDEHSGANLYRTTSYFLERIGITSIEDLPELAPYLPDMDDLEDELASVAAPRSPDILAAADPAVGVGGADLPATPLEAPPSHVLPHHASPHSGAGTEPDGGTETV